MKTAKLTSLAVLIIAIVATACSKKNSNGPVLGTATFEMNGQAVTMSAIYDTVSEELIAKGLWPGTQDSALLQIAFSYANHPFTNISGQWTDTSSSLLAYGDIDRWGHYNASYLDNYMSKTYVFPPNPLVVNITTSDKSVVIGSFRGEMYDQRGTVLDSLTLINGNFNVNVQ